MLDNFHILIMTPPKKYSPFYDVRRTIIVLRWALGFPLQAVDESYTEFKFVRWLEFLRFLVLSLLTLAYFVFWLLVLLIYDGNIESFEDVIKEACGKYSTSKIDIVFIISRPPSALAVSLFYILTFKYNITYLNIFCKRAKSVRSTIVENLNSKKEDKPNYCVSLKRSQKMIIYGQILNLTSCVLLGIFNYNIGIGVSHHSIYKKYRFNYEIILPLLIVLQSLFVIYGPIPCTVELLICEMIDGVSDIFKDWTELLNGITPSLPINQRPIMTNIATLMTNTAKIANDPALCDLEVAKPYVKNLNCTSCYSIENYLF